MNVRYTLFDLNGLILSVSEGLISELLCIHNEGMGSFYLHGLILCVSEGCLSVLLYSHNENTDIF